MLKKFCQWRGCKETIPIDQHYCTKHIKLSEETQKESQKHYDVNVRYTRDKQYFDFYNSKEWIQTKSYVLNRFNGICLYSYYILHKIVPAQAVHHIEELKENWDKRLDIDNLIPLSAKAHDMMRGLYKRDKEGTQTILRELLKRWQNEMKGRG